MVSLQASTFAAVALLAACAAGLLRLFALRLSSAYRSLVVFFACEFLIVLASECIGVDSSFYAYSYVLLVPLEWFAIGFVLRQLYGAVFARYRGFEIFGRWSIYAALVVSCVLAIAGAGSTGHFIMEKRTLIVGLEFASSCVIVGSVILVGFILFAISHYPIELHQNVLVNCRFFALFMLVEAVALLINRFTSRRYTLNLNVTEIALSAFILFVWPLLLSRQGAVTLREPPRRFDSDQETRLLCQLNEFNELLLRVARK